MVREYMRPRYSFIAAPAPQATVSLSPTPVLAISAWVEPAATIVLTPTAAPTPTVVQPPVPQPVPNPLVAPAVLQDHLHPKIRHLSEWDYDYRESRLLPICYQQRH